MTLGQELEKIWYFMKRDMISFSTYKTNILILVFTAIFGALSFAYLGQSSVNQTVTELYHTNYTTYLLIGLAFNTYLGQALTLVQKTINPWSLEEVLVSPTHLTTFIIGSSIWGFIWSTGVRRNLPSYRRLLFRSSFKRQHCRSTDCSCPRHWNIYRNQHDWLRNSYSDQTRRPSHGAHNHSDNPFWKRAFSTPSTALWTSANRLRDPTLLLYDVH